MIAALTFSAGVFGLLVAGHLVVEAASSLGARIGLHPTTIGLTIVAAGTSAPELAVVFQAIAADDTELAVGSIIGSNIANVLLVLGLAASLGTIRVVSRVVQIDIPVMILASLALLLFSLDGLLNRADGLILLTGLAAFVLWTLRAAPREHAKVPEQPAPLETTQQSRPERSWFGRSRFIDLCILAAGIGGLAFAAQFVVEGAENIAVALGVPELIIGLTIVALGTSAPEIVTSLIAALRGRRDLAVGNAIGSNIFNILLVFGAAASFSSRGVTIGTDALELDMPILLAAAVACLPIVFWDHKFDRWEGVLFVGYYVAYIIFLTLDATGHRASDPFTFVLIFFVMPLTALTVAIGIFRQRAQSNRTA